MNFQQLVCKPSLARFANPLKNGAGYRIRTRGPLITKHVASLKTNGLCVNRAPDAPQLSATYPASVNLSTPTAAGGGA